MVAVPVRLDYKKTEKVSPPPGIRDLNAQPPCHVIHTGCMPPLLAADEVMEVMVISGGRNSSSSSPAAQCPRSMEVTMPGRR
jgi:hypothetical protein